MYKGFRDRKRIKFQLSHMKMSDKNYGHSIEGNYENNIVTQTLNRIGTFQYSPDD